LRQAERFSPIFCRRLLALTVLVSPMASSWLQAATPIESASQEYLRQQERERLLRQQQEQAPDVRLQAPVPQETGRLPSDESPSFMIERIVLTGDTAEQFQWALAFADQTAEGESDPALQRSLGTRGINLVMRRIQNAIVGRGFVTTRVLAEAQDLSTGTLQLTVIPGRIRTIRFAPESDTRATQWNAVPANPGDLLNLRDIEQALENFKRVPTVEADIQITPAEGDEALPGESDLVIAWRQRFPFRLTLSADDSGTKATGKYQGSTTLSGDHLLALNDLLYVNLNHDLGGGEPGEGGTKGYVAHYSLPFDYWLLGFTTSHNDYHQSVAGASQTYLYSGESENNNLKLSRLVYRDAVRKTTVSVGGWERSSKNFIEDTEVEVQRRRMAGWELGVNHREFIGTATLDFSLNYRRGTGALNAMPAPEELFDEGTSRPKIFTADAHLRKPFALGSQQFQYTANWRAQWNDTPLVPQDRFAIGGRYTVRGFDGENTLLADRGWLIRNDLGWMIGQSGQELYLGLDYGEVGGASSDYLVGKRLSGAVLGLRGGFMGGTYDLFIGEPLSHPDGFETADIVTGFMLSWSF
jgi:hemolysin activation/secretion protein